MQSVVLIWTGIHKIPTQGTLKNSVPVVLAFTGDLLMNMKAGLVSRLLVIGVVAVMGALISSCKDGASIAENLNLDYSPANLNFGSVNIDSEKVITVTLTHIGTTGNIEIGDIKTETLGAEFTIVMPAKTVLAPTESTTFDVVYKPKDSAVDAGYVVISHNVATSGYRTRIAVSSSGQTATLITEPSPIDFGDVNAGTTGTLDIIVKNVGTAPLNLEKAFMDPEGSDAFKIVAIVPPEGDSLPVELAPEAFLGLTLQYAPQSGKTEQTLLFITGVDGEQWSFDVFANGLGPKLAIAPAQIELGGVEIGETGRAIATISNIGNDTLKVTSLGFSPGSAAGLTIEGETSFNVAPGASKDFYVNWAVTEAVKYTGAAIGWVSIVSNDAASPAIVSVFGRVNSPLLAVIPEELDMGFGAQGLEIVKSVTIRNEGFGDLIIKGEPTFFDTSESKYGPEFRIQVVGATPVGGNYILAGGTGMEARVKFTNKGPATGTVTSKLRITSNDKGVADSETIVPITVSRAGTAECVPQIAPAAVDFGLVPMGFRKELPIRIVNTGAGYCSFKGAMVQDCTSSGGMFGGCPEPFTGTKSSRFTVVSQPPVVQNGIVPGGAVTVYVRFAPPNSSTMFGDLTEYTALLSANIYDAQLKKNLIIPKATGTGTWNSNLKGTTGVANLAVLPSDVKFGLVTLGCASKKYQICAYNTGAAPLQVTGIKLDGCTPEFKLKGVPTLPQAISAGHPLCFGVQFVPQDTTQDSCILKVLSNEQSVPELFVGLSGEGTIFSDQTDEFTQLSGQMVDILFIIDDSGSMGDDQQTLIANFGEFIKYADVWNNDYHIGVVSTGLSYDNLIGKLNFGNPRTMPRYITPGPNAKSQFADLANLGSDGDNTEGALANAQAALSAPLVTDTEVSCSSDLDCQKDPNICTGTDCPYKCLEGTCGGWNKGFLREDAQLEIIALSDEEDQSSGDLGFYIDFFRSLKGFYNQNMMHFNAICGTDDGTLVDEQGNAFPGCTGPTGAAAQEAKRYIEAAQGTNGKIGSICDPNYKTVLNEIGSVAFGLKQQFFLSRIADPNSITVKVRGVDALDGWTYEAESNSIVFDPLSSNMPQEGDKILVHYETLCLPE
jgi:hypothetical protein